MAYSKKIAACIIGSNGKIYDEDPKGQIAVPFDEEFKIRIINKNSKKIGFDVFIDGEKVTKTGRIIVNAYERMDLERYVDDYDKGTKFRFVPKNSEEAKMEGKDKEPYTGLVEVRAYLEKERIREIHHDHHHHHHHPNIWYYYSDNTASYRGYSGISGFSGNAGYSVLNSNSTGSDNYTYCSSTSVKNMNNCNFTSSLEEGAIVKGSISDQSFCSTYVDLEEDYISLKMYLMGYYDKPAKEQGKQLEFDFMKDPKFITKKYCTKCGNQVTISDNYCGKCGGKVNV